MSNKPNLAKTARRLDLDAARAARAEAEAEPIVLVVNGEDVTLPGELPLAALEYAARLSAGDPEAFTPFLQSLLGTAWEALKHDLTVPDLEYLAEHLFELYGIEGGAPES